MLRILQQLGLFLHFLALLPSASAVPCPCPLRSGTFCDRTGICEPCPAGRYGASYNLTSSECDGPCAAGFWCGSGSTNVTQNACAAGRYGSSTGLKSSACDGLCAAGYWCPPSSITEFGAGACSPGSWCDPGSTSPTQNACAAGRYGSSTGLKSSACDGLCAAGYWCPPSSITAFGAGACSAGFFCGAGSTSPTQSPCPGGRYGSLTGNTLSVCDGPCYAGYWCPPNSTNGTGAGLVDCGYYSTGGAGTPSGTGQCDAGSYGVSSTVRTSPRCDGPVAAGYYSTPGTCSATQLPCEQGTFGPFTTLRVGPFCTPCPAGSFCPTASPNPVPCPPGTEGLHAFATSAANCTPCKPGRYSSAPGASLCALCPAGTASLALGATSSFTCVPCVSGSYASEPGGAPVCLPCLAGFFTSDPKANAFDESLPNMSALNLLFNAIFNKVCSRCPPGTTGNSSATSTGVCVPCPAGYFNPLPGRTDESFCRPCPVGSYASTLGQASCQECPFGSFSSAEGSSTCSLEPAPLCASPLVPVAAYGTSQAYCAGCPRGSSGSCPMPGSAPGTLAPVVMTVFPNRTCPLLSGAAPTSSIPTCTPCSPSVRCPGLTALPLPPLSASQACNGAPPLGLLPSLPPSAPPVLGALATAVGMYAPTSPAKDALAANVIFFILVEVSLVAVYVLARLFPAADAWLGRTVLCQVVLWVPQLIYMCISCNNCQGCRRVCGPGVGSVAAEASASLKRLASSRWVSAPDAALASAFLPLDTFFKNCDAYSMSTPVRPLKPVINRPTPWGGLLRLTGVLLFFALASNFLLDRAFSNGQVITALLLLTQEVLDSVPISHGAAGAVTGVASSGSSPASSASPSSRSTRAWNTLPTHPAATLVLTVLVSGEKQRCRSYLDASPSDSLRWGAWQTSAPTLCLDADAEGNTFLHTFTCASCMLSAQSSIVLSFNQSCQSMVVKMASVDASGALSSLLLPPSTSQATSASGSLSSVNWTVSAVLSSVQDLRSTDTVMWPGMTPTDSLKRFGYTLLPASSSRVTEADGSNWATAGVTPSAPTPPLVTLTVTWKLESYYSLVTITERVSLVSAVTSIIALLGVINAVYIGNPEKCLGRCLRQCGCERVPRSDSKAAEAHAAKTGADNSNALEGGATGPLSSRAPKERGEGSDASALTFCESNPMLESVAREPLSLHQEGLQTSSIPRAKGEAGESAGASAAPLGESERAASAPVPARKDGGSGVGSSSSDGALAAAAGSPAADHLPEGWQAFPDEDGNSFFYHTATGVSQWALPTSEAAAEEEPEGVVKDGASHFHNSESGESQWPTSSTGPQTASSGSEEAAAGSGAAGEASLPPGWTLRKSRTLGGFYYKHVSGATQWTPPLEDK